jgi:hypothetical protein
MLKGFIGGSTPRPAGFQSGALKTTELLVDQFFRLFTFSLGWNILWERKSSGVLISMG